MDPPTNMRVRQRDAVLPDRPSLHGKLLGEALAALAEIGRQQLPDAPALCATCAFRAGSVPNQSASTGKMALDIVLGIDSDDFACHHGMREGAPTKRCVGAILAKLVPQAVIREHVARLLDQLDAMAGDTVRLAFDRWWAEVDPRCEMTVYELASAYGRSVTPSSEASRPPSPAPSSRALRASRDPASERTRHACGTPDSPL